MTTQSPDPFDEVIGLLLHVELGRASDAQRERLNELLANSQNLRIQVASYLQDEVAMREELAAIHASDAMHHQNSVALVRLHSEDTPADDRPHSQRHSMINSVPLWLAATAACFFIALVGNFGLMWQNDQTLDKDSVAIAAPSPITHSTTLGSLTLANDCVWGQPREIGDPFDAGKVQLNSGLARISLVNGVVLTIEGSAEIDLKSADHVLVNRGNVYASVSEQAIGFCIETPTTKIVDVGTDFVVSVNDEGHSAVEVVSGAVTCLPNQSTEETNLPLLTPGSTTLFDRANDAIGKTAASQTESFQKRVQLVSKGSENPGLFALEKFAYPLGQIGDVSKGFGWDSPWLLGFNQNKPAHFVVRRGQNLRTPVWFGGDSVRYSVHPTGSEARRKLKSPLNLSTDADYFVSFPIRKRVVGSEGNRKTGGGINFRNSNDKRFGMGISIDYNETITSWTSDDRYNGGMNAEPDTTYLIVMKIVARRSEPDNILFRAFTENDAIEINEPSIWNGAGKPAELDGELDLLVTWSGGMAVTMVGQIRIGDSWSSVLPLR
jgi:hypothetical protein